MNSLAEAVKELGSKKVFLVVDPGVAASGLLLARQSTFPPPKVR